jgi:hypothetical protein
VTSFAETCAKPACRAQLERLATWQIDGRLIGRQPCCLARDLRDLAPALAGQDDETVIRAFDELVEAIYVRDAFADGTASWCELIPEASGTDRDGQALKAAQDLVELTLDALMAGT